MLRLCGTEKGLVDLDLMEPDLLLDRLEARVHSSKRVGRSIGAAFRGNKRRGF